MRKNKSFHTTYVFMCFCRGQNHFVGKSVSCVTRIFYTNKNVLMLGISKKCKVNLDLESRLDIVSHVKPRLVPRSIGNNAPRRTLGL